MRVHRVHVKTVTKHCMKASGGTEILPHPFLTTVLDKNKWSYSRPGHFTPDTHLVPEPVGPDSSKKRFLSPADK
jgi:hypothetical protein